VKPWQLVLGLAAVAVAIWFVRRWRRGRNERTLLVIAIACVVAAVLIPSFVLLVVGVVVFAASLAVSYVSARRNAGM
jgi:hypothetical protein